jgi:hypothetical protein
MQCIDITTTNVLAVETIIAYKDVASNEKRTFVSSMFILQL